MKVYANKLIEHLARKLSPVYIITGDEPMQLNQCCDAVREHARMLGYAERTVFSVDIDKNCQDFLRSAENLSLFSNQKIIEIRMPSGKPGKEWGQALNYYMDNMPADTLLLISGGKLERGVSSSAWYKKADKQGVTTAVWPLKHNEILRWIGNRFRQHNLKVTASAIGLIAIRVEGNLLAAEQEISKLTLLFPQGKIDDADVISSVANSSRFSVFDLTDAALENSIPRITRILYSLQAEGVAPVLVLWSMSQDVRRLCEVSQMQYRGASIDEAINKVRMPPMRRALIRKAVSRHCHKSTLELQSCCAHLDRLIKGSEKGNIWHELLQLALLIAGNKFLIWK